MAGTRHPWFCDNKRKINTPWIITPSRCHFKPRYAIHVMKSEAFFFTNLCNKSEAFFLPIFLYPDVHGTSFPQHNVRHGSIIPTHNMVSQITQFVHRPPHAHYLEARTTPSQIPRRLLKTRRRVLRSPNLIPRIPRLKKSHFMRIRRPRKDKCIQLRKS